MVWWAWAVAMLPFVGLALVALYVGYVAYETKERRRLLSAQPPLPDPAEELARINTELARAATGARRTLELARDAVQRGTR
ncbi:MAG TPA: hypothetical protein VNX21_05470 [Candidatus Thermoplasmatota archaeon]|nr:hypothetical protein [Candidatus Thermoplasmatota archaeon]